MKQTFKCDYEENWKKAKNFIPKIDEVIIYLPDETTDKYRYKLGNGITVVDDLPFVDQLNWKTF